MDFEQVRAILPQQNPFIMVDKVLEIQPNESITCLKNVTGNETVFQGHFPERAIFPGVLITEALAQSSILLFYQQKNDQTLYLLSSTKMRFKHPVVPGDQLILRVNAKKVSRIGAIVEAEACVQEKVVAKGELSFSTQNHAEEE
ncbi:3-hydroxyacyl-ACP dehydratase FabZ [Caldalkalibacillus salinus]|uniref:3-hydroxyacyl-ACP dehydratase FabZ n=1 Tax=Caldalkalibacillus salinus TaxID=2803787 RepID=UPI0019209B8F|nr:3-hydroxyacyl-ACP dehydratase FabZ [Caldalkalibacillus salinus]